MGRSSIIQLHDGSTSAKNKYILHDIDVLNVHNTHIFQNQQKQDYQIKIKGLCKKQTIDMKRNKNLDCFGIRLVLYIDILDNDMIRGAHNNRAGDSAKAVNGRNQVLAPTHKDVVIP